MLQVDDGIQLRSRIEACPDSANLLNQIEERVTQRISTVFPVKNAEGVPTQGPPVPDHHGEVTDEAFILRMTHCAFVTARLVYSYCQCSSRSERARLCRRCAGQRFHSSHLL